MIFHPFTQTSSTTGEKYFSTDPETPSCILSQYLWFSKFITVDTSSVNFTNFSHKNINFVSELVTENCNFIKSWETLKNEYHLDNKWYFQWMQLIHAILLIWKQKINHSKKKIVEKIMSYKTIT